MSVLFSVKKILKESTVTVLNRNNKKCSFSPTTKKFCCTAAVENKNEDEDPTTRRGVNYHNIQLQDVQQRIKEVGITEYLGPCPKIIATIKEKYSDFQVNEIDPEGNIVRLTDVPSPHRPGANCYDEGMTDESNKYIHFTMFKENLTTSDVVTFLNRSMRNHYTPLNKTGDPKITYAGRKDKRGQTTQRMCVANSPKLHSLLINLRNRSSRVKFGNYSVSSKPLSFGQLKGNHFKILLRNIEMSKPTTTNSSLNPVHEAIEEGMKNLKENGFINYWGLQRFGYNAEKVGSAILKMDWQEVFDLILEPRPNDHPEIVELKSKWFSEERDPEKIRNLVPKSLRTSELGWLFIGLSKYYNGGSGDLLKVFQTIPWDIRSIYFSAFTSFLWNHVASFRLKTFGLSVVPGDLVPLNTPSINSELDLLQKCTPKRKQVVVVTEEDVKENKYSIYDVVLPVLGSTHTTYSSQILQDFCNKLLDDFGLPHDTFSTFRIENEYEPGYFRNLLMKPENMNHKIISYGEHENLSKFMPSDWEIFERETEKRISNRLRSIEGGGHFYREGSTDTNPLWNYGVKNKTGAVIEFSLPPSAYATMALREIIERQ